jgi:hypothetical protein
MQRVLSHEKGIPEYQAEFSNMRLEPPSRCSCGCAKFHKWGTYRRYVVEEEAEYQIPIQRYLCVKCRKTYSYLPSFCLSGYCYSADLVMKLLSALLLRLRFVLGEMRRRAYIFLKRFVRLENLWLVFLRARGFGYFPKNKQERTGKIFKALLEQYAGKDFASTFLAETGRHFMATK